MKRQEMHMESSGVSFQQFDDSLCICMGIGDKVLHEDRIEGRFLLLCWLLETSVLKNEERTTAFRLYASTTS